MRSFVSISSVLLYLHSFSEDYVGKDWACVRYLVLKTFLLRFNFSNYAFRSILYTFNADKYNKFLMPIAKGEVIIKICTKSKDNFSQRKAY